MSMTESLIRRKPAKPLLPFAQEYPGAKKHSAMKPEVRGLPNLLLI